MDPTTDATDEPTGPPPAEPPSRQAARPGADPPAEPPVGATRATPGEVVRPVQRTLERPPSERYAAGAGSTAEGAAPPGGSLPKAVVGALVPAAIGAALLVLLASPLAISEPLVVVALVLGLTTGAGTRPGGRGAATVGRRRTVALVVAVAAVAIAEIVVWQLALGEGGVLPFFDYQWTVFGPVALLQPLAAGLAAWATA